MLLDRQKYTATVIGGLMTTLLLLMGVFELIPSPAWLTDLSLNGRKTLWQETVIAIQETSLLGVGFGNYTTVVNDPHNSYLRMFLALGITGGVIYTIIIMRSILQSARQATNLGTLSISLYLVAFWYVQMLNSLTFIGISFHSAFISLLIGYHIWSDSIVNSEPERVTEA
jgi:O-antigen ligase